MQQQATATGGKASSSNSSGDVGKELLTSTLAAGSYLMKKGKKLDQQYDISTKAKVGAFAATREAKNLNKKHHVVDKSKSAMANLQAAFTSEKVPSQHQQQREAMKYDQRQMMSNGGGGATRDVAPGIGVATATSTQQQTFCKPDTKKVKQLMSMGFTKDQSGEALSRNGNNLELASNYLLG